MDPLKVTGCCSGVKSTDAMGGVSEHSVDTSYPCRIHTLVYIVYESRAVYHSVPEQHGSYNASNQSVKVCFSLYIHYIYNIHT